MKKQSHDAEDSFCDKISLRDFNKIQPHGVLLVLDKKLRIIQYSKNAAKELQTSVDELLTQPISNFLTSEFTADITTWLVQEKNTYKIMLWHSPKIQIQVLVYIRQESDQIILEIEKNTENTTEHNKLFDLTQNIIASIEEKLNSESIDTLAHETCEQIQKMTGYDRVIIYKFDPYDNSGLVIAEVLRPEMDSYLGLHFPENDIPQSVRAMYLKLPLRYIPTILENPVALIPEINPITNNYLDLSYVNLRMVAPIHVKYMINMKIVSATSMAIIVNKKLWGIIACHHKTAKYLSLSHRFALLLIANAFSVQISALENSLNLRHQQKNIELRIELNTTFITTASLSDSLDQHHNVLMKLISASGMSVYYQGTLINYGATPTHQQIKSLVKWLQRKPYKNLYATASLPSEYKPSARYKDKASGLLVIQTTALHGYYLLFYRPERIATINWAGNPSELLISSPTEYCPRQSFKLFVQTINNTSARWNNYEMLSADFIQAIVANKQLQDLLESQATHDPLTKLLNRLYLEQQLSLEIQRCIRENSSLALLLADIDFFKRINDKYGHQAGDVMLSELSKLLKSQFRDYDYIYRYGGEEFLILIPGMTHEYVKKKAETLRKAVKKLIVSFNNIKLPSISISIGISTYAESAFDTRSLIAAADTALYQAKANGRDQVVVAPNRNDINVKK